MLINLIMGRIYVSVKKNPNCCLTVNNSFALVNSEQRGKEWARDRSSMATLIAAAQESTIACICYSTCGGQVTEQGDICCASTVTMAQGNYSLYNLKRSFNFHITTGR